MPTDVYAVGHSIHGERSYQGQTVLTYKVQYPQFTTFRTLPSLRNINTYYHQQALSLASELPATYYPQAVADLQSREELGAPFYPYEIQRPYTITYGQNCVLSLYLDEYIFTGGAHGTTTRASDTWNARNGERILLSALFPQDFDYAELLKGLIEEEIGRRNAQQSGLYFEDYADRVEQAWSEANFYLTPEALVLYFRQYDIAPYSTGIPTFAFPYALVGATVPICR